MTLILWLGALLVLAVAAASFVPVSTRWSDFLSRFVLQAAGLAILLVALGIVFRAGGRAHGVLLLGYALCVARMAPYLWRASTAGMTGVELRVIFAPSSTSAQLEAVVREEKPDVVVCASGTAGLLPYMLAAPSVTIFSALPILDARDGAFTVEPGGKSLRIALAAAIEPLEAWWRAEQPGRLLVLGRFDTTMYSHRLRAATALMQLKDARSGRGIFGTHPAHLPTLLRLPLDHVLVSQELRVAELRVLPAAGGDHLPLAVVIKI
jgi:hypothetical protein